MRYCARRVVAREKHDLAREGAIDEIELAWWRLSTAGERERELAPRFHRAPRGAIGRGAWRTRLPESTQSFMDYLNDN
jgi:hypothetical protein